MGPGSRSHDYASGHDQEYAVRYQKRQRGQLEFAFSTATDASSEKSLTMKKALSDIICLFSLVFLLAEQHCHRLP